MFYKYFKRNKKIVISLIIVGIISLAFGVLTFGTLSKDDHDLSMLMGMFSGMGSAFIVMGIIFLIRIKIISPEKLKQEAIEQSDERNIQILRASFSTGNTVAIVLLAIMAFVFVWLGYRVPSFISIGAIYVDAIATLISYNYYSKKM